VSAISRAEHRRVRHGAWLALALASGCADPSYAPNGRCEGAGCEQPTDGAVADGQVESALDWREQLRGTYALRIRNHSRVVLLDNVAGLLNEVIWRGDVTVGAGGKVVLTTSVCRDHTTIGASILGESSADLVKPAALAGRTLELLYEEGRFRTVGEAVEHGFRGDALPECAAGKSIPRRPEQVWLRDTCTCPGVTLPTSADDCRVTDPDGDGRPGYTVQVSGAFRGEDWIRNRDGSSFTEGRLDPQKRHRARYTRRYEFYQLGCMYPPCARSAPEPCPGVEDYVEFAPIDPGWSCDDVTRVADDGSLFPTASSGPPAQCSR
jgi:hypothetical protein